MGVDITHIVRHKFKDIQDINACKKYVINTAYKLKSQLHDDVCVRRNDVAGKEIDNRGWEATLLNAPKGTDIPEFSIRLNRYQVELILRNGFWQIESYFHYCHLFMVEHGRLYLREIISDIARVLGENEIWHAEEYYTWNGGAEMEEVTFEEWLSIVKKKLGSEEKDLDAAFWLSHSWLEEEYPPIVHDDISDLNQKFVSLQSQWPQYKFMGLLIDNEDEYVVQKGTNYYWFNPETGQLVEYDSGVFENIDWNSDVENYIVQE